MAYNCSLYGELIQLISLKYDGLFKGHGLDLEAAAAAEATPRRRRRLVQLKPQSFVLLGHWVAWNPAWRGGHGKWRQRPPPASPSAAASPAVVERHQLLRLRLRRRRRRDYEDDLDEEGRVGGSRPRKRRRRAKNAFSKLADAQSVSAYCLKLNKLNTTYGL